MFYLLENKGEELFRVPVQQRSVNTDGRESSGREKDCGKSFAAGHLF